MSCPECGGPLEPESQDRRIVLTPGTYALTFNPQFPSTVVEGPVDAPDGRRVDYRPATGGQSVSETSADGEFTADLSGPLVVGRLGESRAVDVLVDALRAEHVARLPGAVDARGQDGLLRIDGRKTVVQVITMPADSGIWQQFRDDGRALSHSGDLSGTVALIRAAVERKKHAKGDIVVLDAAHFGALAWRPLIDAYIAQHGDPVGEFGFADVWIIGPTIRSSLRLRGA